MQEPQVQEFNPIESQLLMRQTMDDKFKIEMLEQEKRDLKEELDEVNELNKQLVQ